MAEQFDLSMNAIMHRAFLRDLGRVADQVRTQRWGSATRRWRLISALLHDHHTVEDEHLWPVMIDKITDPGDLAVVQAMEVEHEELAEALSHCQTHFAGPPPAGSQEREQVLADLARLTEVLQRHCAHEESEGEPLIQRYVTPEEFKAFVRSARSGENRMIVFPWAADGAEPRDVQRVWAHLPRPVRIFLKPRMERAYLARLSA